MEDNEIVLAHLRIQMFGQFRVYLQQVQVQWPTQKSKSLFQILLIEPGRLVSTDQLLDYLWPDLPSRKAQNNLWVTVSQLRRVLQPGLLARAQSAYIIKQDEGYRFSIETDYWLDIETFTTHLTATQSATENNNLEVFEKAKTLYRGEYLEDELYAEWVQQPRNEWRQRYEQLLSSLAAVYVLKRNYKQAIYQCREILALDRTRESVYRLLMRCYASLGERGAALKVYAEAIQVLKNELDLAPMTETTELAQQIEQLKGDWKFEIRQKDVFSPFVGRNKEIELFNQFLTQASVNQGCVLVIKGEPGIGKTRLIKETTLLASQQDFLTLTAQCYKMEKSLPYQTLIELARQLMEFDPHWKELATIWLRELALLVPEMNEVANAATTSTPTSDEPDESQQGRLFQAFFHLFENQSKKNNMVLVIEDIQWADSASLQCYHYLARHIPRLPIVFFFTLRDENLSTNADLLALLHSLERENHTTSISLSRLTKNDTKKILTKILDSAKHTDQISEWFQQETDGNPFFLVSLLQSLKEEGLLKESSIKDWLNLSQTDPKLTLPEAIQNSVRDRLQRLQQSQREVLDWMSVYGRPLDFSTLQKISKHPHISLLNIVEQLTELQLIEESSGQYDFNHNKIREVVYHDLSTPRLNMYHQQIGVTLEKSDPSKDMASILAYHFEAGIEKKKALGYWMKAGEHALDTFAHESAANHYERALALTEEPSKQMDVYYGLGQSLMRMDDYKLAAGVIQQGLHLLESHKDDYRNAKLLYGLAQNASRQHRPDGAKKEVEAALIASEKAGDDQYIAQSLFLLTEVYESCGDLSSALETATKAQIVSSQLGDFQLEARALVEIGFLNAQQGEFDKAVNAARNGLKLLEPTSDRNSLAYAWNILGRALGGRGDYGEALDAFQNSQEEAEKVGDRYLIAQALNMRGWLYRELGDYDSSLNYDQEGVKLAQKWDKPSPEISARLNVCLDVQHLGNPERAFEMLKKIEKEIEVGAFGFHKWRWRLRLLHARGLCFLSLNEPEKVLALAKEGLTLAETNFTRKYVALNNELLGVSHGNLGNNEKAITAIERAVTQADKIKYQPVRWRGRFQLAKLYKENDRLQDAEQSSAEATKIIHVIADGLDDTRLKNIFINSALNN